MNHLWSPLLLAVLSGAVLVGGLCLLGASRLPRVVRLPESLAYLEGKSPAENSAFQQGESPMGLAVYRLIHLPLSDRQARILRLKGQDVSTFYSEKAILALVGLALPSVVGSAFSLLTGLNWGIPVAAALLGSLVGFFVPDVMLLKGSREIRQDAGEALFTYFDLITLERLSNQSAAQALHSAAELSDHTLFRHLRTALEKARLQQQPPYSQLRLLADRLELPELADVADVMQLDEQGASLTAALRARVKELRDAHLNRLLLDAQELSERMTVFMVLPALIFGLIFLVPPVLRLIS